MRKTAQMKMSFGMIFSLILIAVFIVLTFYGISKFLEFKDNVSTGKFVEAIKSDVEKLWKSTQGTQEVEYNIPSSVKYICFVDYNQPKKGEYSEFYDYLKQDYFENENMFFYPLGSGGGIASVEIKHIDIESSVLENNPLCAKNEDKLKFVLRKDYNSSLVKVRID